jgi:hypothetical protein
VVALDQLLRLGLGARRVAAGVADQQLDLAPGDRVVSISQKKAGTLLHLNADLSERPGFYREQPDLDRHLFGDRRQQQALGKSRSRGAFQQCASTNSR